MTLHNARAMKKEGSRGGLTSQSAIDCSNDAEQQIQMQMSGRQSSRSRALIIAPLPKRHQFVCGFDKVAISAIFDRANTPSQLKEIVGKHPWVRLGMVAKANWVELAKHPRLVFQQGIAQSPQRE